VHFFIISPLSFRAENNPDQRTGEDKRIEERAQGTVGILGREDPNLDLER
jgi:hypothetical protein